MADPRPLYFVMTVVVLGLVAWVVTVLLGPVRATTITPAAGVPEGPDDPSQDDEPTGPHALILVTAVGRTDKGKRENNEDAYGILEDHHLFVIADGMGRHAAGEVASKLCVDAIAEAFRKADFGPSRKPPLPRRAARLRGAICLANEAILREAEDNEACAGMGTTVVGAYFSQNNQRVYVANVGDSRCYRLRAGKLIQLTQDHTLGGAGIEGRSSMFLARTLGQEPNVDVDVLMESPLPGDTYLLCSDGLSRSLSDDAMRETIESAEGLDRASQALIEQAIASGGRDNITAILVRVDAARATGPSLPPERG